MWFDVQSKVKCVQHEVQLATYRESDAAADDPPYGFSPWGAPLGLSSPASASDL